MLDEIWKENNRNKHSKIEKIYLFINDICYNWGYIFYLNLKAKLFFRSWTPTGENRATKPWEFLAITCYLLQNVIKTACSRCNWFCFLLDEKLAQDHLANRYVWQSGNHEITFDNHLKTALTTMTICFLQKWNPARLWSELLEKKMKNPSWQLSIAFILFRP